MQYLKCDRKKMMRDKNSRYWKRDRDPNNLSCLGLMLDPCDQSLRNKLKGDRLER